MNQELPGRSQQPPPGAAARAAAGGVPAGPRKADPVPPGPDPDHDQDSEPPETGYGERPEENSPDDFE